VSCNRELSGIKVMFKRSSAYIIPFKVSRNALHAALLSLLISVTLQAGAQDMFIEDTIAITAVTVTATASERQTPYTVFVIDSALMAGHMESDLASLLMYATPLAVKRYGNHGLASVSVRGLPGSHTTLKWHGLTVNSAGNGYTDFALIPLHAASSVKITQGGYDLSDISGSIGGKVELSSEPLFKTGLYGSVVAGAGSYNYYTASAITGTGSESISVRMSLWGEKARNDFLFINGNDPDGVTEERRVNSSCASGGAATDLAYRIGSSTFAAHLWYGNSERELPGPVTTVQQDFGERQSDRSLRSVISYSLEKEKISATVTAGGTSDVNLYYHENPEYNGDNRSSLLMLRAGLAYRLNGKAEFGINAGNEYQSARSLSYSDTEHRNVFSASLSARINPGTRVRLLLQARQMIVTGMVMKPEFTAGAAVTLSPDGTHLLKASISRTARLPCLNDLYWVPGGNSSLRHENATGGEASYSYVIVTSSGLKNSLDLVLHGKRVNDLIQWIPGVTGIWSAENVRSVNVYGLEGRLGSEVPFNELVISSYLNYGFTRSVIAASEIPNDRAEGSQLIYVPGNLLNLNMGLRWKMLRAGVTALYQDRRYTTSDNSEWLPPSFIADAKVGAVLPAGKTKIGIELNTKNIFNSSSESVRNYPMPLRTFNLRLTINFTDNNKNNEEQD
jgi:iron complex outermembrane receptor protein